MPPPHILKRRHSLVERNILPLVKKMKNYAGQRLNLGKLRSNMGIEELSDAELANKFKKLTNEAAEDILEMSSKGMSSVNLKTLLHYTILLANETGALETNLDLHYLRMLLARKATQRKKLSFNLNLSHQEPRMPPKRRRNLEKGGMISPARGRRQKNPH